MELVQFSFFSPEDMFEDNISSLRGFRVLPSSYCDVVEGFGTFPALIAKDELLLGMAYGGPHLRGDLDKTWPCSGARET